LAAVTKVVRPSVEEKRFNCPRCGAFSHHTWWELYADKLEQTPVRLSADDMGNLEENEKLKANEKLLNWFTRKAEGDVFLYSHDKQLYRLPTLENVWASMCYSCSGVSVWIDDHVVFPAIPTAGIEPNSDLSDGIKRDFREASSILDASPRGAAALLRLCIQKLCVQLGEKGQNLNDDIASLVSKGLDVHVQQALDIVRVVGNNAVHPGQIDLRDDRDTAMRLFELVNEIAEDRITRPARVKKLYEKVVPESARKAIEKRDNKS
jgi:hypothetical protein